MQTDGAHWNIAFNVSAWEAWAPGLESHEDWERWAKGQAGFAPAGPAPSVAAMPSLLRRRAGSLDRLALEVAYRLAPKGQDVSSIFASRHGEVARSVEMLRLMAKGEAPLPMTFSLSVHNAAAGLYSIAREDKSASNSVAAHQASLATALLEGTGQILEGRDKVLVVCFDEGLPVPYQSFEDEQPTGWSLGLLLSATQGKRYTLSCAAAPEDLPSHPLPQALAFLRLLAGAGTEAACKDGRRLWTWRKA